MIVVNFEKARAITQAMAIKIEDQLVQQAMLTAIEQAGSLEQLKSIAMQIGQSK